MVDDDTPLLESVTAFLELAFPAAIIRAASSPDVARAFLESEPVHVVLSDYRLGGAEDGVSFLHDVATRFPAAKRVAMTGSPDEFIRQSGRRDGYSVLAKPVDVELLRSMVQALLPKDG